jgi:DNA-binding NarL/FixJ family response regulator
VRVVIVDDNIAVRDRLAMLIADIDGLEISGSAADGVEALVCVAANPPDVLVLDLEMPRANGFRVLSELQQLAPSVITVVVSNHCAYREHALNAGAAHFFDKGTELDALIATLTKLSDRLAGRP